MMNLVYAAAAYPFGKLSDRMSHIRLLALGLVVLIGADSVLAYSDHWGAVFCGVALWGLHMGITQGLLAGLQWDRLGPAYTFYAGIVFCVLALAILVFRVRDGQVIDRTI
jgi:MFS family permease